MQSEPSPSPAAIPSISHAALALSVSTSNTTGRQGTGRGLRCVHVGLKRAQRVWRQYA